MSIEELIERIRCVRAMLEEWNRRQDYNDRRLNPQPGIDLALELRALLNKWTDLGDRP